MLKMFTWSQYLVAVAILLVLYYLYVAVVYYRQELQDLISKKQASGLPPMPGLASSAQRGPLITAAVATLVPSIEEKAKAEQEEETTEEDSAEVQADQENGSSEASETDETAEDTKHLIDINDHNIESNEKSTKFTKDVQTETTESEVEELEQDFTVGVAQLNDYLGRAADGEITQTQLVQEMPALENTALLAAFYKTSNQNSQQVAAALFADMPTE